MGNTQERYLLKFLKLPKYTTERNKKKRHYQLRNFLIIEKSTYLRKNTKNTTSKLISKIRHFAKILHLNKYV